MWEDILEEELHLALESMREAEQLETLGGCPRISVNGSLTPGLAWRSRAQMGRGS